MLTLVLLLHKTPALCIRKSPPLFAVLEQTNAASTRLYVRPSVRIEQLGSDWTDFHEIRYLRILLKSVEEIQVSLKSGKNNGYFT